jgi:DNA repair protein RadC
VTTIKNLIALGLTPKVAARVAERCGSDLRQVTTSELEAAGCHPRKAERAYRAIEAARLLSGRAEEAPAILGNARDVWLRLRHQIGHLMTEHFVVVSINIRNQMIAVDTIAIGTVAGVEVHPREVFRAAIRAGAAGIVLAHNHPSGDASPSDSDFLLTTRLREAGRLLGIPVMDHVVVTDTAYVSIAEHLGSAF